MGSRSSMVILVIGITGLGAMGFMMKLALDSNPSLVSLGRTKKAIAQELDARGLEEVGVRTLPRQEGYRIRTVFNELPREDAEALAEEVARLFVERFEGRQRRFVEVSLERSTGWGCSAGDVVYEQRFPVAALDREKRVRIAMERLAGREDSAAHFRVAGASYEGDDAIRVEIVPTVEVPEDEVQIYFERARASMLHILRGLPVRSITMVLRSPGEPSAVLHEERFAQRDPSKRNEPRIQLERRPAAPGAGPTPTADPAGDPEGASAGDAAGSE